MGRPGAYSTIEHLNASLGYALALFVNVRLGWKGLPHSSLLQTFVMYNNGLYYVQLSPLKKRKFTDNKTLQSSLIFESKEELPTWRFLQCLQRQLLTKNWY